MVNDFKIIDYESYTNSIQEVKMTSFSYHGLVFPNVYLNNDKMSSDFLPTFGIRPPIPGFLIDKIGTNKMVHTDK